MDLFIKIKEKVSKIAPHESQGKGNVTWLVDYHKKKTTKPRSYNSKFCSKGHKNDLRSARQI